MLSSAAAAGHAVPAPGAAAAARVGGRQGNPSNEPVVGNTMPAAPDQNRPELGESPHFIPAMYAANNGNLARVEALLVRYGPLSDEELAVAMVICASMQERDTACLQLLSRARFGHWDWLQIGIELARPPLVRALLEAGCEVQPRRAGRSGIADGFAAVAHGIQQQQEEVAGLVASPAESSALQQRRREVQRMVRLASSHWSPAAHPFLGSGFRRLAALLLLVARRCGRRSTGLAPALPFLPLELWFHVCSFLWRSDVLAMEDDGLPNIRPPPLSTEDAATAAALA